MNVCSNGWLSFTSTSSTNDNQSLPTSAAYPENLLAPFWDDLTFNPLAGAAQAFFFNDGSRFIVEYVDVPHYGASPLGPYTFEVVLYPSGKIVFQYLSMSPPLDSATIGIQNSTRTTALQVIANVAYVHDGLAVSIQKTPGWLRVTPSAATLPGRAAADLTVAFDGTGLEPGVYLGDIHLVTNDPATPVVDIPVSMQIVSPTGTESQMAPARFDLALAGGNPARGAVQLVAALPERSELDLRVYDVRGNLVRHLTRTTLEAGVHRIGWNGCDDQGETVAAGVYFIRMRAGTYSRALQVTHLR